MKITTVTALKNTNPQIHIIFWIQMEWSTSPILFNWDKIIHLIHSTSFFELIKCRHINRFLCVFFYLLDVVCTAVLVLIVVKHYLSIGNFLCIISVNSVHKLIYCSSMHVCSVLNFQYCEKIRPTHLYQI